MTFRGLVRLTIGVLLTLMLLKLSVRFMGIAARNWYITLPVILVIYLLVKDIWNGIVHKTDTFFTGKKDDREIILDKEPTITDADDSEEETKKDEV